MRFQIVRNTTHIREKLRIAEQVNRLRPLRHVLHWLCIANDFEWVCGDARLRNGNPRIDKSHRYRSGWRRLCRYQVLESKASRKEQERQDIPLNSLRRRDESLREDVTERDVESTFRKRFTLLATVRGEGQANISREEHRPIADMAALRISKLESLLFVP